jgi:GxxExxY protein
MERSLVQLKPVTDDLVEAATRVHRELGPGLLESAYEACLAFELADMGYVVERQRPVPVVYRGVQVDCGYRADLVVEGAVLVELKCVEDFHPVHIAQVLTYMKLMPCRVGYLLNFNVRLMKQGIKRLVL